MTSSLVRNAEQFATLKHEGQTYGAEFPYPLHLRAVVNVLTRFGADNDFLLCGGWLHDTIEDTDTTYQDIELYFGKIVADLVAALSKPKEGKNRREKDAVTLPRIRGNWRALVVKLADRIANVEASGAKVGMYVKEHPTFKAALIDAEVTDEYYRKVIDRMWVHLDGLIMEVSKGRIGFDGNKNESASVSG